MFCSSVFTLASCKFPSKAGGKQGDHPVLSMNDENSVDTLIVFMISKLTFSSAFAYSFWLHLRQYWRHCTTILFICSEVPSVSGWYAVETLCLMPVNFIRAFWNFEIKSLS